MLIDMPASPKIRKIEWEIEQPSQANRSEFTGKRRVVQLAQAPRWRAKVTMPPILGEARVFDWRAFAVDCEGVANSFRVPATEADQCLDDGVVVDGSGQIAFTVFTRGWTSRGQVLKRGQMVTINDQLLSLMAPVIVDGTGRAQLSIKPYLRLPTIDGMQAHVRRPFAVVSMVDPKTGWTADVGQQYAVAFDVEEAF